MKESRRKLTSLIKEQLGALSESVVVRVYRRFNKLWKPYGDTERVKSIRDVSTHLEYLVEALAVNDPLLFQDYINFVRVRLSDLSSREVVLQTTLDCIADVLNEKLGVDESLEAREMINLAIVSLRHEASQPLLCLEDEDQFGQIAREYFSRVMSNDRKGAKYLILQTLENGADLRDIHQHVLQPCLHEVGRLWQINKLSVSSEHYFTNFTYSLISYLSHLIVRDEESEKTVVTTCAAGERHDIGLRMICDCFELEGWKSHFLGADLPTASLLSAARDLSPDVVAISTTMITNLSHVSDLIQGLRGNHNRFVPKIIVGGYPFNLSPNLWRKVGADASAYDAREAVATAETLLAMGPTTPPSTRFSSWVS